MPLPAEVLALWSSGRLSVSLPGGSTWSEGALPATLRPRTWLVPGGEPAAHAQLFDGLKQAKLVAFPATITLGGGQVVALWAVPGIDRARAIALAYKRRQPAIIGLLPVLDEAGRCVATQRVLVTTGVNSREDPVGG